MINLYMFVRLAASVLAPLLILINGQEHPTTGLFLLTGGSFLP